MTISVRHAFLCTIALAAVAVAVAACGSSAKPRGAAGTGGGGPQAVAFADCMRSHGVPDFPDPGTGGGFQLEGDGVDRSSPAFTAADAACRASAPTMAAGHPIPAAQDRVLLTLAKCMRGHGVPRYPDPSPDDPIAGKQAIFRLDPGSPAFQKAAAACGDPGLFDAAGRGGGGVPVKAGTG